MKLLKRFFYYGIGLIVGSIFVYFIWEKKDVQFDYMPNARVLKNIRIKKPIFSPEVLQMINSLSIDSTKINQILDNGNVDIWNKVTIDTCILYKITGRKSLKNITLTVVNCDSISTVEKVVFE